MTTRAQVLAVTRNPPPGWGLLFAPVPGRSAKVRCLLCGRSGYGLAGHPARCETCRRPFSAGQALASHQTCKLHHACCREHTTVPAWANPFAAAAS